MHGNAALYQFLRQNNDQVDNSLALQKKIQEGRQASLFLWHKHGFQTHSE